MKKLMIFALSAMLFGCSTVAGFKPVVNEKADKFTANTNVDMDYCGKKSMQAAGFASESLGDVLAASAGAAAIGAISGAAIPGAVSAGTGAVIGAPIGAVVGLWYGLYESDETFKRAYNSCMSQLGHPVIW